MSTRDETTIAMGNKAGRRRTREGRRGTMGGEQDRGGRRHEATGRSCQVAFSRKPTREQGIFAATHVSSCFSFL